DSVLARGERSPYAAWFDIDWAASTGRRLVLPLLGDEPDTAIASGDLTIRFSERGEPRLAYYDHSFPIARETLPDELQLAQSDPEVAADAARLLRVESPDRFRALLDAQHYRLV